MLKTRLNYTHEAMARAIMENPGISQGELAQMFGYTQSWISIILNSDAFQAQLAALNEQFLDPRIRASIEDRMRGVAARSLEVLSEKLAVPASLVPDALALEAAKLSTKGLGFGAPKPVIVGANRLEKLAENITVLFRGRTEEPPAVITHEVLNGSH